MISKIRLGVTRRWRGRSRFPDSVGLCLSMAREQVLSPWCESHRYNAEDDSALPSTPVWPSTSSLDLPRGSGTSTASQSRIATAPYGWRCSCRSRTGPLRREDSALSLSWAFSLSRAAPLDLRLAPLSDGAATPGRLQLQP